MYLGKLAGAAMPLMWAHAEYIKLLRSARDGQVFDLIPIVADRYLAGRGHKGLEVWKSIRQVRHAVAGQILRVQAPAPFRLHWTSDEWQTVQDTDSTPSGLGIYFVDIPVAKSQHAPIRFTFFWTDSERWEGRDYEVGVLAQRRETSAKLTREASAARK
jgi:glucoamylase